MRTYEALFIVSPEMEDEGIQTVVNEVEALVTSNGGTIVRSEIWGKRKLAYTVKKHTEGSYVLLRFEAEPDFIARLENYFRLSEAVIRDLVVYFDEHTLRLEAEQQKRNEEEIRGSNRGDRRHLDDDDDDDDDPIPSAIRRKRKVDEDDEDDDDLEENEE